MMRANTILLSCGAAAAMLLSSSALADCSAGFPFQKPVLDGLTSNTDPDLYKMYAVMAARVGSIESLDTVFINNTCTIQLTNGASYQTALGPNDTWHGALAHVLSMEVPKEERNLTNVHKLLSHAKLEFWPVQAIDNSTGIELGIPDVNKFNLRLGDARDQGIIVQYPDDNYVTVAEWDTYFKKGIVSEWNVPGPETPSYTHINMNSTIDALWDNINKPVGLWIPKISIKPYFGPEAALLNEDA